MKTKRLLAGLLTLVMLVGLLPTAALAAGEVDLSTLVNIAETQHVTVENSGLSSATDWLDTTASHLTDGVTDSADSEYKWVNGGVQAYINDKGFAPWVSLSFAQPRSVGGLKIYFEHDDSQDVTYTYNIWTKASADAEYTKWGENLTATKKANGYIQTHTFASLTDIISIKIEITSAKNNNNTTDGAWIVLRQVQIFGTPLDLSTLTNIASDGTVTTSTPVTNDYTTQGHPEYLTDGKTDTEFKWVGQGIRDYIANNGKPWVNFNFGENRSIGGLKITFEHKDPDGDNVTYKYNVLGKASGATEYVTLFSDCTATKLNNGYIQTHAFSFMKELSDIKVEFTNESTNAWIVMTQLEVFGEAKANPYEGLVDLAPQATIEVPGGAGTAANMTDDNYASLWNAGGEIWPAEVTFALPGNARVRRIEIDFEKVANRSVTLGLETAFNGVISDYSTLVAPATQPLDQQFVYESPDESGSLMSHLRIYLNDPNPTTLWTAIAEVKIWAVDETIDLKNYADITEYATETSGEGYMEWNFGSNQQVAGFKVTLANGATATLKGKLKKDKTWKTYIQTLQSGDNVLRYVTGMSAVRVELSDPTDLTEFELWGTYVEPTAPDPNNLAFDMETHSNYSDASSYLAVDGNTTSGWQAEMYPTYLDIDLEANYNIEEITVFTPTTGYTQYTVYTSMDGRDFDLVASKLNNNACAQDGDKFTVNTEARIVRVYLEYYSENARPTLYEVKVKGTPSDTEVQTAPEVDVGNFEDTKYAKPTTTDDVIAEVQGIISRQVGAAYVDWFTFALADQAGGYDYFTLSDEGGKIKVTGNNGVSLATGINHYLKYFCNVHISQVGNQVNMPAAIVPIDGTVHKETKFPVRYAYNYCTHSYSMPFWNEEEWRNELDWLALNGVNVVLDITGQEEVWREFLMSVGYTHQEAKDFLAGPGYYAWAYMANLTGFGGPIHDSFLTERTELGRKNQRIMRTLGMEPVLQAFSGMVPTDLREHDDTAEIITQGEWCGFRRPDMLRTDTATYDKYAAKFYEAQKKVFGDAKYYATDPFHEGGNVGGMSTTTIASELLDSLLDFDSDAVWVIQAWQGNPTTGLLAGLRAGTNPTRADRRDHALVLDLWAENSPHNNEYGEDTDGDGIKEFSDTPWVWCMLNNFGGRMGLHGNLDSIQQGVPAAANNRQHMKGIGISPEGSQENPLLYDFLFETIWTENASGELQEIDMEQWLKDYALRRYGAQSDSAEEALNIYFQTVYKDSYNRPQGAIESVINAWPGLSFSNVSAWGSTNISYSKAKLEAAAALLLKDYDTLKESDAYLYDVADVLKQVLSNTAQKVHADMVAAYQSGNAEAFAAQSEKFLDIIDMVEQVLGTRTEFTFGKWTGGAVKMAENADDFTKRLYLRNSKALVTTWGSIVQHGSPGDRTHGLHDYSNRQWAGLTNDYYKVRWALWIDAAKENLAAGITTEPLGTNYNWFPFEWEYARDQKLYSSAPNDADLQALGEQILTDYSVRDPLGENDIDPATITVKYGTEHYDADGEDDRAINVLDRDTGTIWHTEWTPAAPTSDWWIAFDLGEEKPIDGLRYLPRQGNNTTGRITGYKVYVSSSDTDWAGTTDNWEAIVENGTWASNGNWKTASFDWKLARYVKLEATSSTHDYVSASEIRVTFPSSIPAESVTLDQTSLTLYVNEGHAKHTATLKATVGPELATDKAVTWGTSNVEVAAVNSATGAVTAMGVGTATVTATAHDGSGASATCTVTVKKEIEGDVSVTGALKFGSTLTANGAFDSDVLSNLTYTWYRGEGTSGTELGTGKTYIPVQADIGSKLTVKASATAGTLYTGQVTFTTATAVTKADGHKMLDADPAYENCSAQGVNDGKITGLRADHVYQYQMQNSDGEWPTDEASWTTAPANSTEITGLAAGSYRVRHIGDETRFPGEPSNTVTIVVEGGSEKKLTIPPRFEGGTVRANRSQIPAEDPVTLTVTPDQGYELATLEATYTDGDGVKQTLTPTKQSDGKYTFTMPAFPVDVAATFTKITYTIGHGLTNITCNEAEHQHTATYEVPFSIILTPETGYNMPNTLTVTETGTTTKFTDFTYDPDATDPAKRVLTFPHGVTCDITIEGAGVPKTYTIDHQLTDINCDMEGEEQHRVTHGAALTIHLTAAQGYYLPEQVTVKMSGQTFGDFTYTRASDTEGQLAIAENKITGPLVITAAGVIPLISVAIQGTAQAGQELTAQVRPSAAKVSYQWFRGETAIEDATGKTYTLTDADVGAAIKVEVTGVEGYTGTKTSGAVIVAPIPVEKSALQAAYDAAKGIENDNYTEASWAAFEAAREEALAVLDNADATQAEVDAAAKDLADAQKALKKQSGSSSSGTSNPAVPVISTGTTDDGFPTTTETRPDGTKVDTTEKPDGTKEIVETKPDGTVTETTEKPDGTKESTETKPDGTVTESVEKSDGSKEAVETKPDGTVTETKIDAEGAKVEKVTDPEENVTITATDAEGETVAEVKVPAVIPESEKRFEDVPVGHWADEAIHKLAAIEVVNGVTDTQYSPVVPMKRGDLATVLFRLSNGKEGLTDTFADVESGKYYADGIAWAAKAGVVEGYSDTEFKPEAVITREQLALMLMRYAKLLGIKTDADKSELNAFADGGKTSSWAVDGVAWCVKAGIIQGMDDVTLSPNTNVSRAQVAVMLQRFIDLVK